MTAGVSAEGSEKMTQGLVDAHEEKTPYGKCDSEKHNE